ncbi:MAG: RtcB family protein, partial [Thermoanaerobaculia bacterium]
MNNYELLPTGNGVPIKAWIHGVPVEESALQQLRNIAQLPFLYRWVAAMPDVHFGIGATVGSVIASKKAIIPAAVGVDIGCGMMATRTTLRASDLPDSLAKIRSRIEAAVPHGRTSKGGKGDQGAWRRPPQEIQAAWAPLVGRYQSIVSKHPRVGKGNDLNQLGTLGSGNHFIEICLDESDSVWVMLHSGSRGVGNRIGSYFIELAKQEARKTNLNLPDINLAWLDEGSPYFDDYIEAVQWAQDFAAINRQLMMASVLRALAGEDDLPPFRSDLEVVNCHHNYVAIEEHFGEEVFVTRKGAVRARQDDLGIIPGSMG